MRPNSNTRSTNLTSRVRGPSSREDTHLGSTSPPGSLHEVYACQRDNFSYRVKVMLPKTSTQLWKSPTPKLKLNDIKTVYVRSKVCYTGTLPELIVLNKYLIMESPVTHFCIERQIQSPLNTNTHTQLFQEVFYKVYLRLASSFSQTIRPELNMGKVGVLATTTKGQVGTT